MQSQRRRGKGTQLRVIPSGIAFASAPAKRKAAPEQPAARPPPAAGRPAAPAAAVAAARGLASFPGDVLAAVLAYLPFMPCHRAAVLVCRSFHAAAHSEYYWYQRAEPRGRVPPPEFLPWARAARAKKRRLPPAPVGIQPPPPPPPTPGDFFSERASGYRSRFLLRQVRAGRCCFCFGKGSPGLQSVGLGPPYSVPVCCRCFAELFTLAKDVAPSVRRGAAQLKTTLGNVVLTPGVKPRCDVLELFPHLLDARLPS
ncbi:hypothetical protein DIPPA_16987 [Diplonema papillatum]|nr:hypothetical protein DIPPA_16987 [Diplonema papillatum]